VGLRARIAACLLAPALVQPAYALASDGAATDEAVRRLARAAGQSRFVMRIGLEDAHHVSLTSSRPFRVVDPASGDTVWRPSFEGDLRIVAEGGPTGDVPRRYRVQVGAFSARESAERRLDELKLETGASGVVHHDPDRGVWRVRLGAADDRLALSGLLQRLRELGVEGPWIAEEPVQPAGRVELRLVDASYDSLLSGVERLVALPAKGARLVVDGKAYRGIVELRVTPFGTVRPINWIELESYLLGVVPAELGPEAWPELAALQAQSVAARTYAWRNRGQFAEEGFDLCATPRCQVYEGADAEHPLSDRAVSSTRGEILTWEGDPIVALYTATCGGHTEDGAAVFPEEEQPYLTGVPCRAEATALASLRGTVEGRRAEPIRDAAGLEVTRDWALLQAAGVIAADTGPATAADALAAGTLRRWTAELASLSGLDPPGGEPGPVSTLGEAAAALVADLGWNERAAVLLSDADLPALLRDAEAAGLADDQARALAYLVFIDGLQPATDGRLGAARAPGGARLVPALVRIGETYQAFGLREGVVSGMGERSVRLVQGRGEIRLPLAERPYLFGWTGGKPAPVERLEIWPGDQVRFRTDDRGAIDFLELRPPVTGVSDDRSAAVYSWQVRRTRRQLETTINRRASIGRLKALEVRQRGVSGRVIELAVVGDRGEAVVRGFDVRRLLDLREILTVFEIQRDAAGEIEAVVFAGKGWGHGVGLCQVGAYGMALRGAKYREIVGHYYRGARLERLKAESR
jgi:stage II sporulation protein D